MADGAGTPPSTTKPSTPIDTTVTGLWAVQITSGGIPEQPELYDNYAAALRAFVELAVRNDCITEDNDDGEQGYFGNDDDDVRMWEELEVEEGARDCDLTPDQREEVGRRIGILEERARAAAARTVEPSASG